MKNKVLGYVVLGTLFALLSLVVFLIPTIKTATFWVTYIFTIIAFVAQIGIWKIAFEKENTLKSKFLGIPIIHVGIVYLAIQIIALLVFTGFSAMPFWITIIVCVFILGTSVILMISGEIAKDEIEKTEEKVKKKVLYIKELQVEVKLIAEKESDDNIKAELLKLAEKIRFSDPMSNEKLVDLETKIFDKVEELKMSSNKQQIIIPHISFLQTHIHWCH